MRLTIPKGGIKVNQLHDELLVAFPSWRGTPRAEGGWEHPLLSVEHTEQEIRLTLPDGTPEEQVRTIIAAHQPRPRKDWQALRASGQAKLRAVGLTEDELRALSLG